MVRFNPKVWSEPFVVNSPGNFIVKLGPPVTSLEEPSKDGQEKPHMLRVVRADWQIFFRIYSPFFMAFFVSFYFLQLMKFVVQIIIVNLIIYWQISVPRASSNRLMPQGNYY
jgi:hypothetical protein